MAQGELSSEQNQLPPPAGFFTMQHETRDARQPPSKRRLRRRGGGRKPQVRMAAFPSPAEARWPGATAELAGATRRR